MNDDGTALGGHSRTPSSSALELAAEAAEEGVSVRSNALDLAEVGRRGPSRIGAHSASFEVRASRSAGLCDSGALALAIAQSTCSLTC